jgi:hypothetical protein
VELAQCLVYLLLVEGFEAHLLQMQCLAEISVIFHVLLYINNLKYDLFVQHIVIFPFEWFAVNIKTLQEIYNKFKNSSKKKQCVERTNHILDYLYIVKHGK